MLKTLVDPYYVHKQALVFEGPQGIGKTPFCRNILPEELRDFIKYALALDLANKDSRIALSRYLLIIIDEIDDFFKDATNRIKYKAFATQDVINERLPYAKSTTKLPRIASFLGTCNESNFLNDATGTQRFTCFKVRAFRNRMYGSPLDKCVELFDFAGLAASMFILMKRGFSPEYTREEYSKNEEKNEAFKYNSPEYETLVKCLTSVDKGHESAQFMTTTSICNFMNGIQSDVFFNTRSLGKALIRLKFKRVKKNINGNSVYGFYVKKMT